MPTPLASGRFAGASATTAGRLAVVAMIRRRRVRNHRSKATTVRERSGRRTGKSLRFRTLRLLDGKNFARAEIAIQDRVFLVGPNGSGKSNFLDAFRFLRDLAPSGGGSKRPCPAAVG